MDLRVGEEGCALGASSKGGERGGIIFQKDEGPFLFFCKPGLKGKVVMA